MFFFMMIVKLSMEQNVQEFIRIHTISALTFTCVVLVISYCA